MENLISQIRGDLTQTEWAEQMEVSQATVSRWENDEFRPSYRAAKRIRAFAQARGGVVPEIDDLIAA